jgi:hypothetical protein
MRFAPEVYTIITKLQNRPCDHYDHMADFLYLLITLLLPQLVVVHLQKHLLAALLKLRIYD